MPVGHKQAGLAGAVVGGMPGRGGWLWTSPCSIARKVQARDLRSLGGASWATTGSSQPFLVCGHVAVEEFCCHCCYVARRHDFFASMRLLATPLPLGSNLHMGLPKTPMFANASDFSTYQFPHPRSNTSSWGSRPTTRQSQRWDAWGKSATRKPGCATYASTVPSPTTGPMLRS